MIHLIPRLLLAVVAFSSRASAVFADEAWTVDYHHALLGEPQSEATFFHRPSVDSKASLIYTLSDRAALGAINPRDGSLVWRHLLQQNASSSQRGFLRATDGQETVISGSGNQVAAWSAGDGRLGWSTPVPGVLEDVEVLELADGSATSAAAKDAIALTDTVVQRLDGASGALKWEHKLDSGDSAYQLSASTTHVFAVLLHRTMLGYIKIRVVTLDPVTGQKTDEYTLSSENELASSDTILSVGANSASPIIAWTDAAYSVLKINVVGSKTVSTFNIEKHGEESVQQVQIHAPYHANSLAHFLVHFATATSHWAEVFHIDVKKGKVDKAYSLPKVGGQGAFTTSTSGANVYFTRVTTSEILTVSSASHGVLGRWPVHGFGTAGAAGESIEPIRAVSELSIRGDVISAIRTAIWLSTGDWVLLREGSPVWLRPEALAGTVSATFALPAQVGGFVQELQKEAHSNLVAAYVHRVNRHLAALRHLPSALLSLPQRFVTGFLGTDSAGDASTDSFGFHKIVVCATDKGRLIALDAGSSDTILWNRKIDSSKVRQPSLRSTTSGVISLSTNGQSDGHAQLFNATTGELLPGMATEAEETAAVRYSLKNGQLDAYASTQGHPELWHFTPTLGERIVSLVSRPVNDPVASIGKVLGDRRVLYKYLNPNLALLVTASDVLRAINVYVIDTTTGTILHSGTYGGVDAESPIASTMSENWFAFSFTAEASNDSPKGHYLVVGEMFESLIPDDRGPLTAATNFSTLLNGAEPVTLVHAYQIPEAPSKLTVTQTRQGITSRALIAVLPDTNGIVAIPYAVLDPRRPANRDPTKDEQMEGLFRYAPVIEFDPTWYLSHRREVMGIANVVTTPALIESTSIIFAYGLDVFGTRLSPSFSFDILGKDFNKFQMLATVGALAVGTFVVAPLVMRKLTLTTAGGDLVWEPREDSVKSPAAVACS